MKIKTVLTLIICLIFAKILYAQDITIEDYKQDAEISYSDNFSWWKLAIPSYSQYENRRFFRASIINLGMLWIAFDIRNFSNIKQRRADSLSVAKNNFELAANQSALRFSVDSKIEYDNFNPDENQQQIMRNEREYEVLNLYQRAVFWERRLLNAENQYKIDAAWLTGIFLYSAFDGYGAYKEKSNKSIKPFDAVARSIVLPGWGQIYTESYSQAGIIYGLGIAFGAHAYYLTKEAELLDKKKVEGFSSDPVRVLKKRNTYLFYLLGLYGYNIIDAYVQAELYEFNLELSVKPLNNSLSFSLNYLF